MHGKLQTGPGWATEEQLRALLLLLDGGPLPTGVVIEQIPELTDCRTAPKGRPGGPRGPGRNKPQDILATASVLNLAKPDTDEGTWARTSRPLAEVLSEEAQLARAGRRGRIAQALLERAGVTDVTAAGVLRYMDVVDELRRRPLSNKLSTGSQAIAS